MFPTVTGADLEIKMGGGGVPSSRNSVSAGGLGGAVSPPVVQGKALVGAQGAKPPEALRISNFFYPKNTLKIVF